jgi:hypothetical protein
MKYAAYTGAVLLGIIGLLIEIDLLVHDPWQMFNPYMQFLLLLRFISAPAVWVLLPLTLLFGYLAEKR